jgi:cytidylate kinase
MPAITISRMFGSGGSEVARLVASELGWTLLDNAFVERVATRLHATPMSVEAIEERGPTLAERIATVLAYGAQEPISAPMSSPLSLDEERVLDVTQQVIADAVARGPVVLVGRGAQVCLEHHPDAFHVLCTAPRAHLIERVARREQLDAAEAARRVDEENRRRGQYVKRNFGRDWLDASHYHLCVDTSHLGLEETAALIVRMEARGEDSRRRGGATGR